jgi:hypothetical protein
MRNAQSLFGFALGFALVCPSMTSAEDLPPAAGTIPLRWSPKGKFRVTSVLSQKVEGGRQPASMTFRMESACETKADSEEMTLQILSVDIDGLVQGKKTVVHLERGKDPSLESEAPGARKEFERMAPLVKTDLKARLTSEGLFSVESEDLPTREMAAAVLGFIPARLPGRPVNTGDTWKAEGRFPLPGPDLQATLTFRLERVTDDEATVSVAVVPDGKGELVYSRKEGLVRAYSVTAQKKGRDDEVMTVSQTIAVEPVR